MIKYSELGADKRLNEIVMAGSHDAGITSGAANAKTQSLECRTIYDMNSVAATALTAAAQTVEQKFGPRVRFK